MPIEARPPPAYGPMNHPSGSPNSTFAAAAHRIEFGSTGSGGGTGTRIPPGSTQVRQYPSVKNFGTGGRATVGNGVGAIGTSAAITATGTSRRGHPVLVAGSAAGPRSSAASSAIASSTAMSGIAVSANRLGSALSSTGSPSSGEYGPWMSVRTPSMIRRGPRDSAHMTTAVMAQAVATGRRHSHSTAPAATRMSGSPK